MPQLAGLANQSAYAAGSSSLTGAGAMRVASLQPLHFTATMQGTRTVMEHFYVVSAITPPMIAAITGAFGDILADTARDIHFPHIDSGETYDSIRTGKLTQGPPITNIGVAVSSEAAKFQEFGFVHYQTGAWIQNPFMIPAADAVAPAFVDAIQQVAQIAANRRFLTGLAATTEASSMLSQVRAGLYSYSKWAGDIQALGFGGLSKSRGFAVKGAAGLGDFEAIGAGTISGRVMHRAVGRYGGSMTRISGGGFGSPRFLSGPSARIYNRISGRIFGHSIKAFG